MVHVVPIRDVRGPSLLAGGLILKKMREVIMKKFIVPVLAFCLMLAMAACGITDENSNAKPAPNEPTATIEPAPIEPVETEVIEAPPQITEDMLQLSHHCKEDAKCAGRGCEPWCEPGCQEHCGEQCILHVPNYVGLSVTCPSGKLWCIGQASSEERETLQNLPLDQGYWIEVDPTTEFEVAGIRYVCDTNGTPDPNRESDIPATTYEMRRWGAEVPISSDRMGVVYIIDPDTVQELSLEESLELGPQDGPPEEILAVIPYYIQVTGEK